MKMIPKNKQKQLQMEKLVKQSKASARVRGRELGWLLLKWSNVFKCPHNVLTRTLSSNNVFLTSDIYIGTAGMCRLDTSHNEPPATVLDNWIHHILLQLLVSLPKHNIDKGVTQYYYELSSRLVASIGYLWFFCLWI